MKFTKIGLSSQLEEGLEMMGFEDATPVQEQAIPLISVSYTHLTLPTIYSV